MLANRRLEQALLMNYGYNGQWEELPLYRPAAMKRAAQLKLV
jgi:hypothetical protein